MSTLDRALHRLDRTPQIAFAVFFAAGAVLALQQWLYHHEYQQYLARERACHECPRPASK